jgi:hypothetical protein
MGGAATVAGRGRHRSQEGIRRRRRRSREEIRRHRRRLEQTSLQPIEKEREALVRELKGKGKNVNFHGFD